MQSTDIEEGEDRYHVAASSSLATSGTHVLKDNDTFAVIDRFGDIIPTGHGEQGVYHQGTKFVSRLGLRIENQRPLLLSSSMQENNLLLQIDLTNPDFQDESGRISIPSGTVHLARYEFVRGATCFQRVVLSNYGAQAISFDLSVHFGSDFVDIFEVRGTRRSARGKLLDSELGPNSVSIGYLGLDGVTRRTRFDFGPVPAQIDENSATFRIELEARQTTELYISAECEPSHAPPQQAVVGTSSTFEGALERSEGALNASERADCRIVTSNQEFNDWLTRSRADLRMLLTDTPDGPYPYAGVPWFSTPFGRDAIWTALQLLWLKPEVSKGVLKFLSRYQATRTDADADAEPGKILHEMRAGEMAALHEIPFGRYYGSIDSTPLYLMLAARYYERTADLDLIQAIWPNLVAAVDWMQQFGDTDADGFIEYGRRSNDGLIQQGWKDSNDSVFHRDGSLAQGPIALAEVQGYAYAALRGMSRLAQATERTELAHKWDAAARSLQQRFVLAFFCKDLSTYALALDGKKRPCRVRASNAGHCLYTGIALPAHADVIAAQMMSDEMFSGWGIRTVANSEQRYNPMSYHNGSIWPHDNAIVAAGLAEYGHRNEAARVLSSLFDAALHMNLLRLPELFCGFPRQSGQGPTLYPVACSPQAWASGAIFMLLEAVLGMKVDALDRRLLFRHTVLPEFLHEVQILNLRVGDATVDLRLQRYEGDVGVTVTRKSGKLEVVSVK